MLQVGWRNRETGETTDQHLTCNDATFLPAKSGGDRRVYYLKFENARKVFFWMQVTTRTILSRNKSYSRIVSISQQL